MILALLFIAAIFALGAALAVKLHGEIGYVLLSFGDWTLETSVIALVIGILLAMLALGYGIKLLFGTLRLPRRMRAAYDARRQGKAKTAFEKGMLNWISGRWQRAEIELIRHAADHEAGALNLLMAAEAAHRAGHPDRRDHYLALALEREEPEAQFAARVLRARIALDSGEWAPAREQLLALRSESPKQTSLIVLLAEAYRQGREWSALTRLLRDTERLKPFPPARLRALLIEAGIESLALSAEEGRLDELKASWTHMPQALRTAPEMLKAYVHALARLNADNEAAALITQALKHGWDAELVELFRQLQPADSVAALASVERWLSQYGERPELLFAAARACLNAKLWGKARSYFEAALKLRPDAAGYLELAQLIERSPEGGDADAVYRQGLAALAKSA